MAASGGGAIEPNAAVMALATVADDADPAEGCGAGAEAGEMAGGRAANAWASRGCPSAWAPGPGPRR